MKRIEDNLFEKVLFEPLMSGGNKLFIVSGYATANMAVRHFEYAKQMKKEVDINLVAGMYIQDGVLDSNHKSFKELHEGRDGINFKCNYVTSHPPVHSKVYSWFKDDEPLIGFIGSANYTQNAFSSSMREILYPIDAIECRQYFDKILGDSLSCVDPNIEEYVSTYLNQRKAKPDDNEKDSEAHFEEAIRIGGLEMCTLPLVKGDGEVPERSGLNWGQRPGRNKNQAYINIPQEIGKTDFFPGRKVVFTVITDDEKQLICVRAQDGGKGLHTTLNNSLMGQYFRYRLGLKEGAMVTKSDLLKYGRDSVDFYKIDDETFYLDFSVSN